MTDDNPLVDQDSQFEWGDYVPFVKGGDQGGTQWWNPLTKGQGYTTGENTWYKGLPLIDAARALEQDIQNDDAFNEILDKVAIGVEATGLIISLDTLDWGGLAVAPVMSWLMEHIKPLRLVLDELTGNMDAVLGVAQTWHNMSGALLDADEQYAQSVEETRQCWTGEAASAYEDKRALHLHVALTAAGILCRAWGYLVKVVGECVGITHDMVRDLIAALQGQIVQDLTELATVVGAAAVPQQTMGEIARVTTKVVAAADKVVVTQLKGIEHAKRIITLLKEVLSVIQRVREHVSS